MKYLLLLLIYLSANISGFAQHFSEYTFTTKDGLPSAIVYSTLLRRNGELLVGTAGGLSRFNGRQFTNYDLTDGLPTLSVFALFEDSKQRVWIGTTKGICAFTNGSIKLYPCKGEQINWVGGFVEIDNEVYAYCGTGVYVLKNGIWQRTNITPPKKRCYQIVEYKQGWIFSIDSTVLYYKNRKFSHLPNTAGNPFWYFRPHGDSLFMTSKDGFYLYDKFRPVKLYSPPNEKTIFSVEFVNNKPWLFLDNIGVWEFDMQSRSAHPVLDISKTWSTIITSLQKNGMIWLGGLNGLTRVLTNEKQQFQNNEVFRNYRLVAVNPFNPETYFFSGLSSQLISRYKNGRIDNLHVKEFAGYPNDFLIDKACFLNSNECLVSTRAAQLYRIDFVKRKIEKVIHDSVSVYDISFNSVTKQLFVATEAKIYVYSDKLKLADSIPIVSYCIKSLNSGLTLIQKDDELLSYTYNKTRKVLQLPVAGKRFDFSISESPAGIIAIRTRGRGVRFFEWKHSQLSEIAEISKASGLITNSVYKTVFDENQNAWMHTETGITVVNIKDGFSDSSFPLKNIRFLPITVNNWEYADLAYTHDGKLVLTLPDGMIFFDAKNYRVAEAAPSISISELETATGSIMDSLKNYSSTRDEIILNRDQSSFKITYQSVSFVNSEDLVYSYRVLNTADTSWSLPVKLTSVSFANLSAGSYTFEVKARKTNSEWSKPAVLRFSVKPAFWETVAFKLIAALNLVFILAFIFQLRIRKIRRASFVKNRLTELEMKALRAQLNPHFIYNALNSIQALIASGKQKDAMRYVSKFGKLLRLILEYSEEGKTTLQKELDVNSLYIELEQLRLGFDFSVNITIADDIISEEEKVPALILQPILENALWHGLTNIKEDKHLSIDVTVTETYLIIGVTDNGPGIETTQQNPKSSEKRKSFGSQIVRKRLLTYNNDNFEPVHIRNLKEIGKQGTEVKIFIRRSISIN